MKRLLLLTAGPYFWPQQEAVRARYETLSKAFTGVVLSFVSRREFRRASLGKFELVGWYLPRVLASRGLARLVARLVLTLAWAIRLHRRQRIDVVVAYDPLVTGAIGLAIARLIGARLVVEVNGVYTDLRTWEEEGGGLSRAGRFKFAYARRIMGFVLPRADAVKLLFPEQLDGCAGLRAGLPTSVFHDCVPLKPIRFVERIEPYLLFVGHPWYLKGVDVLLRAFLALEKEFPTIGLKLVGYLPERQRFRDLYEGHARIEFLGPLQHDRVIALMQHCTALVLPSRSEAMGRVLLEAMACRRPIVASRVGGIPTYVRHGENGLLFEPGDVEDLAAQLRAVLADRGLAARLADNGFEYVRRDLSEDVYLARYRAMVEHATADHGYLSARSRGAATL